MTRIIPVCFLVAMTLFVGALHAEDPAEFNGSVRFAILGDRTGDPVPGIYEQTVAEALRLKPEFLFSVGDLVVGYTEDSTVLNERWAEYLAIIDDLPCPFYSTPGNNDIGGATSEMLYRRYVGEPYFSFDYRGIHFVSVDNSRWEKSDELPAEQIDWLAADLKAHADARYTFVFMHKPFWYNATFLGKPDTLHTLFVSYGVDAVFNGHFHNYFSEKIDGILYTAVGSSGGGINPNRPFSEYHFVWATVDQDGISLAPIPVNSVLPWDHVTASDQFQASRLELEGMMIASPLTLDGDLNPFLLEAVVRVTNLTENHTWSDTLRWELPEGWAVSPAASAVDLAPGETGDYTFEITKPTAMYPPPRVTFRAPYADTDTFHFEVDLHVARELVCPRAAEPPALDGKLTEDFWTSPTTYLFNSDGTVSAGDPTFFYLAYDDKYLYLGARCHESDLNQLVAKVVEADGPIYTDDCVGFMIQPDIDVRDGYQIYVNSDGIIYDQHLYTKEDGYTEADNLWDASVEVATSSDDNSWTVEMKLDLAGLGTTAGPGDEWGINFRRKQQHTSGAFHLQIPWSYDPRTFGRLVME